MKQVNIHEAKTHLSRLVEEAARGEAFVIAKAGKPLVKVVAARGHSKVRTNPGASASWTGRSACLKISTPSCKTRSFRCSRTVRFFRREAKDDGDQTNET